MKYGQLHTVPAHRKDRDAPPGLGRQLDRAPKKLTEPKLAPGMHRVTTGALHPYLHSRPLNDETADKLGYGVTVPVHNGMGTKTPEHRGADYGPDEAKRVFGDSMKISAPHGSARLDKAAHLPTKNVGR